MVAELDKKNKFIVDLTNHLMLKYSTKKSHIFGAEDFEARNEKGVYSSQCKDPNKPKEITGFCFRKDLCFLPPKNSSAVLTDIHNFAEKDETLESQVDKEGKNLHLTIGNETYSVTSYIDEGYAGEISVNFS